MRCSACSTENPPHSRFCLECGAPQARRCSSCGSALPDAAKFCLECGQPSPAAGAAPAPSTAPQTYTPRHLAEKILAGRDALYGERKQVTVIFADVVGSTELIRDRDAEDAQRLLDGAVQVMMDAVHRYEGIVSRAMGDGIMALFGAPLAHEDHGIRACYAALAVQDGMRRYAEQVRRAHGAGIQARVGLNSGEVIVRLVSDDLHMDYTAMGQTVHLASRLEQLAAGGTTALSPETLRLAEGYVQVRSLGPAPIRGLAEPVEVFELVAAAVARTRLQAAAGRGLTRFVGRDREIEALYATLERAAGCGQVVALVGQPGVGKSRLVWELTHSHRTEGWMVLESGSVSYGQATSYLPVVDLLKAYCRIEAQDDARIIREKVIGKLLNLDDGLRSIVPPLLALLDVPVEDTAWDALEPARRRRQTLDAVERLLLRESQEQPLLLVFEDLHWIDAETQALLDGLVDRLPAARVLLLVNYRPEYGHSWGQKSYYTQVRVGPLAEESADELLDGLLGLDAALAPLKALLIARTEGNPLFLEEIVRSLLEGGALIGQRGAYELGLEVRDVQVPATVQAVLASRIDRLPPEQKRLLQTAAVIGKDVPDAVLRAIATGGEDEVHAGLIALQAAELVYEARLSPEREYTFKHALTHEVAYGSLLTDRRRTLHAQIVNAIERVYPDRLDEHVELLAHHAERGQVWDKAVASCRQAGLRALDRWANRDAADWLERALTALEHLPESPETLGLALDLRLDARRALQPLREPRRVLAHLLVAQKLAERLSDRHRLVRVMAHQAVSYQALGDADRAIAAGRRAVAAAEALEDLEARVAANVDLGTVYRGIGDHRRSFPYHRRVARWLEGDLARERFGMNVYPGAFAPAHAGRALGFLGRFDEAFLLLEQANRIADEVGQPQSIAAAAWCTGSVYVAQGDVERAILVLERGAETAERWDVVDNAFAIDLLLGVAYVMAGREDEALQLVEQGRARLTRMQTAGSPPPWEAERMFAEAYLLAGRVQEAEQFLRPALDRMRATRRYTGEADCLWLLGEVEARRDRPDLAQAETRFRAGLALAEEHELRPRQAQCHLALGTLYRRLGRPDEARAELSAAVSMLGEMGMTRWLQEAEAEVTKADGSIAGNTVADHR